MDENQYILTGFTTQHNGKQRMQRITYRTSIMEANQNTTNINGKKNTYCQQKN
jgi:hypothetical protein